MYGFLWDIEFLGGGGVASFWFYGGLEKTSVAGPKRGGAGLRFYGDLERSLEKFESLSLCSALGERSSFYILNCND
jgi:hypothetical protein